MVGRPGLRGGLARIRRRPRESIDAVYLWVDGAAPSVRDDLRRALAAAGAQAPEAVAVRRFRDHGELRYSLRSLEQFVPWIRRVHIVTPGAPPSWLDLTSDRCRHVRHEQIFPDRAALPCFNSLTIELQLHRIPGLSRRFVYLNDDMFFGRPVGRRVFVDRHGRGTIFVDGDLRPGADILGQALEFNEGLLAEAGLPILGPPAHAPMLLDCHRLALLPELWPQEYRATCRSTFRSERDLVMGVAYQGIAGARFRGTPPDRVRILRRGPDYRFVMLGLGPQLSLRELGRLVELRPTFFCINDDLGDGALADRLGLEIERTLERMFPIPSSFERKDAA